jgi:hypothetical protein
MTDQTPDGTARPTPAELEAEIEARRAQLAGTIDQLAATLDVKARATDTMASLKDSATTDSGMPRPEVLAAVGSLVAMGVVLLLWRRRRN